MNPLQDLIGRLLQTDYTQIPLFLLDTLRNPQQNPTAFILLLSGATIIFVLIIIAVVTLFLAFSKDEDEEDEYWADDEFYDPEAVDSYGSHGGALPPLAEPQVEYVEYREPNRLLWGIIWVAVFAMIWVVGGTISRDDTVCTSCHVSADLHPARSQEASVAADPHRQTECVACHETPSMLKSVTTALPARAAHIAGGMLSPRYARDYGVPVANSACAGCHGEAIAQTTVDEKRGIKMSHVEPLESNALCTDCHQLSEVGGVIDGFTVGMDPCLRCHDAQAASAECSYCHTKDVGAAVQRAGEFKPRSHVAEMDCSGCHTNQSRCDSCHGMRMPHSTAFMGAGHARAAVEDIWFNNGQLCKRCHTDQRRPCSKCHLPFPGHAPKYMIKGHQTADPYNNGCGGCHDENQWIVGRNFCGNCHPRYNGPPAVKD